MNERARDALRAMRSDAQRALAYAIGRHLRPLIDEIDTLLDGG